MSPFGSITALRSHIDQNSQSCADDINREGIGERHFPERVEAASSAGVTGVEIGAKGNQVVVHSGQHRGRGSGPAEILGDGACSRGS
jgi:hypothetical protein